MEGEEFQRNVKKRPHVYKVSEFLQKYLDSIGYEAGEDIDRLKEEWDEIAGSQIAPIAKPKKLENGVLTVSVTSSVWRSQLQFMKMDLIKKINDKIETIHLQNIIFR